jgi:hypothetical protein
MAVAALEVSQHKTSQLRRLQLLDLPILHLLTFVGNVIGSETTTLMNASPFSPVGLHQVDFCCDFSSLAAVTETGESAVALRRAC